MNYAPSPAASSGAINEQSSIEYLLDAILPDSGLAMIQVEAHFDESVSHRKPHLTCLAGYIFDARRAKKMRREWNHVLNEYKVPFFHMGDCAHGNGVFSHLSKPQRIVLVKKLIDIIKKRSMIGLAATIDNDEFKRIVPQMKQVGSAYSMLSRFVMAGAQAFLEESKISGRIAYFYEAGHASQTEANRIMLAIVNNPTLKGQLNYAAHAFVEKIGNPGVQAADLLAWQWYTDRRHVVESRPRRKDLDYLMESRHVVMHLGEKYLYDFVGGLSETAIKNGVTLDDVFVL